MPPSPILNRRDYDGGGIFLHLPKRPPHLENLVFFKKKKNKIPHQ